MRRAPLRRAAGDPGGVAERLKAADCKSADVRLRRFESYPLHQRLGAEAWRGSWERTGHTRRLSMRGAGKGRDRLRWLFSAGVAQW